MVKKFIVYTFDFQQILDVTDAIQLKYTVKRSSREKI